MSGKRKPVHRQTQQSQFNADTTSPYATYDGFNVEQTQSYEFYSTNYSYDQQTPQLFEDTSSQYVHQDYYNPQHQQQPPQQQPNTFPTYYDPNNFINQQVLMAAGQQLFTNPMASAAIDHYSQSIVNKGKSWVGQNVKYYFAVNTAYVLKKLILIFFPFSHKDWSMKFNPQESVAPKDDLNAPDLYIPSMAFVTYILVAGYLLGLQNRFSPEQLGIQASSALAYLLLEVVIVLIALYLLSINCMLGFFHLISYGGYKFVCIVAALLASLLFQRFGYYSVLLYSTISLGFFLLRSLHIAIQTVPADQKMYAKEPRNGLYLVIMICLIQPISMYFLTRHLIFTAASV